MQVNKELKEYINSNVIKEYENFDEGHDVRHVMDVINRSLLYYEELKHNFDLNINMVYVIAAFHDVGMKIKREGHPKFSREILLADNNLKKWFSQSELETMAEACEDHSTSRNAEPRTIYGKIVSDADKDTDINVGLLRGWKFSEKHFPNLTFDERVDEVHAEIVKRFGDESIGGKSLVKFYISSERNKEFLTMMALYAKDKLTYKNKMIDLILNKKYKPKSKTGI